MPQDEEDLPARRGRLEVLVPAVVRACPWSNVWASGILTSLSGRMRDTGEKRGSPTSALVELRFGRESAHDGVPI